MAYAEGTSVSEEKSRQEIERMLTRMGASKFGVLSDYNERTAEIGFVYKTIHVRMLITLPDPKDDRFNKTPTGKWLRSDNAKEEMYRAEVRRKWRSLSLALKAKLVSVEEGITTFEREFLPYMVTSSGQTVAEKMEPLIREAMEGRPIPATLCLPEGADESHRTRTVRRSVVDDKAP